MANPNPKPPTHNMQAFALSIRAVSVAKKFTPKLSLGDRDVVRRSTATNNNQSRTQAAQKQEEVILKPQNYLLRCCYLCSIISRELQFMKAWRSIIRIRGAMQLIFELPPQPSNIRILASKEQIGKMLEATVKKGRDCMALAARLKDGNRNKLKEGNKRKLL
jgi:hypothetical protein